MRLCLINFVVLVGLLMAPAQAQLQNAEARKFDEFGDILCSDLKARLDNFAVQLINEATTKGCAGADSQFLPGRPPPLSHKCASPAIK